MVKEKPSVELLIHESRLTQVLEVVKEKPSVEKELLASEWLLLEECGWKCDKEVVVNMSSTNYLTVQIEFDFYGSDIVELSAIIDSGSQVCFLNRSILCQNAPNLLNIS